MHGCDEVRKFLYPYLDHELAIKELLQINLHLKACPSCSEYFRDEGFFLRVCLDSYSRLPDQTPPFKNKTDPTRLLNFFSNVIHPMILAVNQLIQKINISFSTDQKGYFNPNPGRFWKSGGEKSEKKFEK